MPIRILLLAALSAVLVWGQAAAVPVIESINPTDTLVGTTLDVLGSGFYSETQAVFVPADGGAGLVFSPNIIDSGHLTISTNSIAPGVYDVHLLNIMLASNIVRVTLRAPGPKIDLVDPVSGPVGTLISIYGKYFNNQSKVYFAIDGDVRRMFIIYEVGYINNGLLRVSTAGIAPGSYGVAVRNTDGQISNLAMIVLAPPQNGLPSSLPNGKVGVPYSFQFTLPNADGSVTWSVSDGTPPPGVTLSQQGLLSGTPTVSGAHTFTVTAALATMNVSQTYVLLVNPADLAVTTATALPDATLNVAYSQTVQATGGVPPYRWSVSGGALPEGIALSQATGLLSGSPKALGTSTFTLTVTDSNPGAGDSGPSPQKASQRFTLKVVPAPLVIDTTALPGGTGGADYSQELAVSGGVGPYTWVVASGALPGGLTLTSQGLISGKPTAGGTFPFTVRVTDSLQVTKTAALSITVTMPALPGVAITGLSDTSEPAQQPSFGLSLTSGYGLAVTGQLTLTFTPDAVNPADDPAVQFSSGGRTVTFNIPTGQDVPNAVFPGGTIAIQTGTVAGTITITASLEAGGVDITPQPAPTRSVRVNRAAPAISSVQATRSAGGLQIVVTGFATSREVTQATFHFTAALGTTMQTPDITVPLTSVFNTWYAGEGSIAFGSAFLYTQPFTVQGDTTGIASVQVTLSNSQGAGPAVSATF